MMKSFLLLIFSVMAGCVDDDILACEDGWVEFTCVYPVRQKNYQKIEVVRERQTITQSKKKNKWEHKDRFSLYHDTTRKYLRVVIKQLRREDFEDYRCKFDPGGKTTKRVELKKKNNRCLEPIIKTMSKTDKTIITCGNFEHMSRVKFLCKENGFICEDILSTQSSPVSNRSFTLTPANRGFNVSISDVSSEDAGVYWCGVKQNYSVTYRKIQLQVHNPPPTPTRSFTTSVPSVQTTAAPAETDDPPPTPTRSFTTSVPSVQTTTAPAETDAGFGGKVTAGVVCAAVLVVVILLVFIYTLSKRRNKDERPKNKEDHSYAEIQERPQNKDSGAAMKTVYVTANFPTNPSASTDYSEITFGNVSGEVNGNIYSTVTVNEQPPVYSTVSNPSL